MDDIISPDVFLFEFQLALDYWVFSLPGGEFFRFPHGDLLSGGDV
jgi:hypothetical protein